jgi:hypothetical protein
VTISRSKTRIVEMWLAVNAGTVAGLVIVGWPREGLIVAIIVGTNVGVAASLLAGHRLKLARRREGVDQSR